MHAFPRHSENATCAQPILGDWYAWTLLLLWLLLAIPLFLGMPLNSDTALYDVQARTVLDGGVAYRDVIEPNLPGALWIHLAIRSAGGWSSELIRGVDLIVVATILWLWAMLCDKGDRVSPVVLLAGTAFYLTRNEWCHAQRDTWMMLPVGLAVAIRCGRPVGGNDWPALAEGVCWGLAFWIKPHVAVPAAAIVALDLRSASIGAQLRDLVAVICGGLLAAVPGVVWLMHSGAWDPFWTMMLDWNPEYLAAGRTRMSPDRWVIMTRRFSPWLGIHLVAVPVAFTAVVRYLRHDQTPRTRRRALLCGCYLAWLVQSVGLQHALDYIHVPAVMLGVAVLGGHRWQLPLVMRRSAIVAFSLVAILATPFFRMQSLQQWPVVWTQGSTPETRSALAHGNFPDWQHLDRVVQFLLSSDVSDGDVTCMNVHSVHVYNETGTRPSTRYWSVSILQDLFPQRAVAIADAVCQSDHRFVVTESGEEELLGTPRHNTWMDNLEPVFESGSYRVLRVATESRRVATRSE